MTPEPDHKTEKPKWLRKLERESWQAELIISGAAILGSFQLPGLLDRMEIYFLLDFDRDSLYIGYIASVYFRVLANCLIAAFVFHFVVRALWIGLVGLNSVYPGGFQANKRFSVHYQDRLREEYGDVDGFIHRLDRLGSGIFGVAFALAGVLLNFGLIGLLFVFVHSWLVGIGLTTFQVVLGIGLLLIPLLLLSLLSMVGHSKRFQDHPMVRKYQWPLSMTVSRFTYPLARRYITTALNLVMSFYADSKRFGWGYLLGMLALLAVVFLSLMANEKTLYFIDDYYHRVAEDSLLLATEFSGEESYEGIYVRPVITDPTVEAGGLTVWIPLPEREMVFLEGGCSIPEVSDDLPRAEQRMLRREWLVRCGREYIDITLNERSIEAFELERQYLSNEAGEQYGMRAFIADPPLRKGKNLLRVTTRYPSQETGALRLAYVPFYYY